MDPKNLFLWTSGLFLQVLLLALLLWRGSARRFPLFAMLIAFYIARGCALFAIFGHLANSSYLALYKALTVADVCLQILFAAEITFRISRRTALSPLRAWSASFLPAIVLAAAVGYSICLGWIRAEWGAVLVALLMLCLIAWMMVTRVHGPASWLVLGFLVFNSVSVVAEHLRRYAVLHRNAALWTSASLAVSWVWIAILLCWLLGFARLPRAVENRAVGRPAV